MSRTASAMAGQIYNSIGDRQARMVLFAVTAVCCALAWFISGLSGVPSSAGVTGGLLIQPHPVLAMAVAGGTLVLMALLTHRLARFGQMEIGLFIASVSLAVLAIRCGPVRYVLFAAPEPGTYLLLAFELILLAAWMFVAWLLVRHIMPPAVPLDPIPAGLTATLIHAVVTAAIITFLAVTDRTPQTIFAVGVGSIAGSAVAHMSSPLKSDLWFWLGPFLAGIAGYAAAWHSPVGIQIGFPQGALGALARPTPLVYASAGTAGSLIGLWWARALHEAEKPS